MGFIKKIWKDRISEFPTRRSLTKTDGTSELVTVARSEGMISEEGDAFSAENMNDFENRVANGFSELNEKIESTDITQERLVGKFNGKNVYEKVIDRHINIPASTNFQIFNIPHGIENFESSISINIVADGYALPFFRDDGYLTTYIFIVDNTNIVLYNKINWNNNFRITFRYTKSK